MNRRRFITATGASTLAVSSGAVAGGNSAYINAVTALIADWRRKDIDSLLARVTDDIVWYSHVGSPPTRGKAAMRTMLETLSASMSEIKWRIVAHAVSGDQIFLEGTDDFVLMPDNRRVAVPYMGIMKFRGGLIAEWRDYFDRGLFNRLKAGEASPPDIVALVERPGIP